MTPEKTPAEAREISGTQVVLDALHDEANKRRAYGAANEAYLKAQAENEAARIAWFRSISQLNSVGGRIPEEAEPTFGLRS
jgi:hypothetical protein